MNTLVAAPTSHRKHYSFHLWEQATRNYPRVMAVNEKHYYEDIKDIVPTLCFRPVKFTHGHIYGPRFNEAWQAIYDWARGHYTHILSLESDVIPPDGCDIVSVMESEWEDGLDFLCHGYPWRGSRGRDNLSYEFGCTMFSIEALQRALNAPDGVTGIYGCPNHDGWKRKKIDVVELRHLDEWDVDPTEIYPEH